MYSSQAESTIADGKVNVHTNIQVVWLLKVRDCKIWLCFRMCKKHIWRSKRLRYDCQTVTIMVAHSLSI